MNITSGVLNTGRFKENQGFDMPLSKVVELGSRNRIFFKTVTIDGQPDIVGCGVPGRSLDFEALGAGWISLKEDQIELDDNGKLIDKSGLPEWARISHILHEASYKLACSQAEANAKFEAEKLGIDVDQTALSKKLDEIDAQYHGTKENGVSIPATKQPLIGRLVIKNTAQCLVVPINTATNQPEFDKAKKATIEISNTKLTQLANALNDPNYFDPADGYLEVLYNYEGADKKTAGRSASFQGISKDLSLKNKFPAEWEAQGQKLIDGLATTPDAVQARNRSLSFNKSVRDIEASVRKYCATNVGIIASIDMESDDTKRAAKSFVDLNLLDDPKVAKIRSSFMEIISQQESEKGNAPQTAAPTTSAQTTVETAPTTPVEAPTTPVQQATEEQVEQATLEAAQKVLNNEPTALNQLSSIMDGDLDAFAGDIDLD